MEHAGYSNSMTCLQRRTECENANIKVRRAYYELLGMGVKIYFIFQGKILTLSVMRGSIMYILLILVWFKRL